jgi:mannose-1-phosphate guanylyltransferase/mannose-6-phosphate isomerase
LNTGHFYVVIPAGGAGSRLWPRSRRSSPKHVLSLSGSGKPLVWETVERVKSLADGVFVLTEARQLPLIENLVPELGPDAMIVEPAARGTTNAIGLAAMTLLERDPEAVMLSIAADHVIRGRPAYRAAVQLGRRVAEMSGELVVFGVKPTFAATGFGYIEAGAAERFGRFSAFRVERFVEKPDLKTAEGYLSGSRHFWNLSMFCFRCDVFVEELKRHGPEHHAGLKKVLAARRGGDEARAARVYQRLPVEAVDYTVMERSRRLLMVPAAFQWVDVGSWSDFADLLRQDEEGNVVEGLPVLIDTTGSFISVPDKVVAVIGMQDVIVVDTEDALLVCPKSRAQDVKKVVEALSRSGRTKYL